MTGTLDILQMVGSNGFDHPEPKKRRRSTGVGTVRVLRKEAPLNRSTTAARDHRSLFVVLLVVISMLLGNAALAYDGGLVNPTESPTVSDRTGRPTTEQGLPALANSELRNLAERFDRKEPLSFAGIVRDDRVLVLIEHELPGAEVDAALDNVGATRRTRIGASFVEAFVPIARLKALQTHPGVRYVRPAPLASPPPAGSLGAIPLSVDGSEVAKTGAAAWHSVGIDGSGVKIGIIDDFDQTVWNGAQANGDVPAPAGVYCIQLGATCNIWSTTPGATHGTAVAEIVHEMAPGASLFLANELSLGDLYNVVDYFAAQGVQIINYSATRVYDGPGDGTGPSDDVIDHATSKGIAWVNAAGNSGGGGYWRGEWTDADADNWLEFSAGDEVMGFLCGWAFGLRWDDWHVGNPTDYDIYIWDDIADVGNFAALKGGSENLQTAGAPPVENFSVGCSGDADADYLKVRLRDTGDGVSGDVLELAVNSLLEYWQSPYSAAIPLGDTANPGAVSVGAVDPPSGASVASYSARGPTNDGRTKPDLSAPAGMRTLSFGTFSGTSAAAPVVAGGAALLFDAGLVANPVQLKTYLLGNAVVDRGSAGPDNAYGAGELYLGIPPSQGPVGVDDAYNATKDTRLVVLPAAGVLSNDADPNGDPLTVPASDVVSAEGGTVAVAANGSFTYDPPADFTGTDTFAYTVSDGALTDTATVTITVSALPPPPVGGGGGALPPQPPLPTPTEACPENLPVTGFLDLSGYSVEAINAVNCLVAYEVSLGTSPTSFSPEVPVTRWQMALFLSRQITAHGVDLPPAAGQGFTDILGLAPITQEAINQLAAPGITKGTTETTFDPHSSVTRWQMALFLTRIANLVEVPLADSPASQFLDIGGYSPDTQRAISQLAEAGIAKGTSPTTFDPESSVLRWQMALFLTRVLQAGGVTPQ